MISAHASPLAATGTGGPGVHVGALARALARRGHRVSVLTRRDDVTLPDTVAYAPGVTVEHVRAGPARPVARDQAPPYMTEFAGELAKRWLRARPDVVHAHGWLSGLAAQRAAGAVGPATPGIRVTQTFHSLAGLGRRCGGDPDAGPPGRPAHEARLARDAAAVIAMCAEEAGELAAYGVPPGSVHPVPCGVDVALFRPAGPAARRGDRPRVVTVGPVLAHAGVDTAVEALCHVPDAELIVAGGPVRAELERDPEVVRLRRLALARGVAGRVVFTGRIRHEDVPALIRSADAAVSVPPYVPSGVAAVEAMACGVPVVVSAVGGHLDTVTDGVTGLYVPPHVPSALAARLRRLLTDPRLGSSLGAAAVARARERHAWTRIAAETEAVYDRVADGVAERVAMADGARS
jgi:D-inositol-3-phosphate glycosyltransferase